MRFGVVQTNGFATVLLRNEQVSGAWHFDGEEWVEAKPLLAGLDINAEPVFTSRQGRDLGVRLRDLDNDGRCELLVGNQTQNGVFTWSDEDKSWRKASFGLPPGTAIVDAEGNDNGFRLVDLNGDGFDDAVFSNDRAWSVHLFLKSANPRLGWDRGWSFKVSGGKPGAPGAIPMIVRGGTNRNNGAWFHTKHLWVQNEETAQLPDLVDRRSFASLMTGAESPAKSPAEALKSFQARPGFMIDLVASEPLVIDPVAFEWGADGKLWVAEMRDYPSGMDGRGQPGGVIKFLEDADGDGRYEKATVFMEGVSFPNGVMPWRKGVLVSAAPEIFYAEDTNGDGKADLRRTLLVGFKEGNQQHRINGFDFGLDGWVYAANGDSGGTITNALAINAPSPQTPLTRPEATLSPSDGERDGARGRSDRAVGGTVKSGHHVLPSVKELRGYDLRFDPDTGDFELVAGQTQFGRHRDDWGNWFGNNNPNWLWHYLVPIEFLGSHPPTEWTSPRRNLANYPERNRVFAVSQPQRRFNWPEAIREVTSANSATPYRDDLFGPDFATSVFISEPANNVVHREVLEPDSITFKSDRAADEQDREFLASTDNWFRPTMLKTGPDGALYVADMYRLVIEHPEYFPEELKNRPDLRAGDDKGRIWRVYPEGAKPRTAPLLAKLDIPGLIAALDSSNGWQRDTAQRLLCERAAASLNAGAIRQRLTSEHVEALRALAVKNARPQTRLQALATLGTLGLLQSNHVLAGLQDSDPRVRATALSLIEPDRYFRHVPSLPRGVNRESEELLRAMTQMTNDPSPLVRFRLALSLGRRAVAATNALVALALAERNPHVQAAILNAVGTQRSLNGPGAEPVGLLVQLLGSPERGPWMTRLLSHLARIAGSSDDWSLAVGHVRRAVASPGPNGFAPWQMEVAAGWIDGVETKYASLAQLPAAYEGRDPETPDRLKPLFAHARLVATNSAALESERLVAIRLLARGLDNYKSDIQMLASLLKPAVPGACQNAALEALKRRSEQMVADTLLNEWPELGPSLRANALSVLLGRDEWAGQLLRALEKGQIVAGEISPAHQQILLKQRGDAVRERATRIFAAQHTDRQQVVRNYESVKTLIPNPGRGALLYQQNCATCHRLKGEGSEVGPDLGTVADKPLGTFLVAMLDPNQAVETKYVSYTATTRGGREVSGIIANETPETIAIRSPGGAEEVLARSDIQALASSKLSLMPEGLENVLAPQDMADLIAFIRSK
ncbi:MAG: c-type cytochrome [Verrucomicrobiales bacterium]|nr:c-type cytochrome [Verrucomicrobiales bacterium]